MYGRMTGSPTPSAPTDAFGLAHLVTPETAPRSFVHFRHETMLQVTQFKWVPRKDAAETVSRVLQPAVRFTLDEIVELPPLIEREIVVPVGNRQKKIYDGLRDYAAVQLREGTITAANGGVVFSKMLQASCGWVYGEGEKSRQVFPMYEEHEKNPARRCAARHHRVRRAQGHRLLALQERDRWHLQGAQGSRHRLRRGHRRHPAW